MGIPTVGMSMYTSAINSYIDRLNTEGSRDPASWLMLGNPHLPAFSKIPQVRTVHDKPGQLCSDFTYS